MRVNEYYIKARLMPSIITSIPILSFYYFGLSKKLGAYMSFLEGYSVKNQIREKIKNSFNLSLLNEEDKKKDLLEARKIIIGAVAQIRNSTRDNSMILQHNIECGFIRNFNWAVTSTNRPKFF